MQGDGVVDGGGDAAGREVAGQGVAFSVGNADDELVPDAAGIVGGRNDGRAGQALAIEAGGPAAQDAPAIEVRHLDAQQRRLQLVDAEVPAHQQVVVLGLGAVRAHQAQAFVQRGIGGQDRAAVAEATQVLRREKRQRRWRRPPRPCAAAGRRPRVRRWPGRRPR